MQQSRSSAFKRILAEPLSIFVLVSAAIFALDAVRSPVSSGEGEEAAPAAETRIVVTDGIVTALKEDFAWLEGRQPTVEETEALVQEWLDKEMVFRDAIARQMHLTDGKMREHLIEKVRLLWAGTPAEPSDEQLLDYYLQNMDEYYSETKVTFEQVFYETPPKNPEFILQRLRAGEPIEGDRYWLGDTFDAYAESILKTSFGGDFFNALSAATLDQWIGPLQSPRGHHYVRVGEIEKPVPIAFENLRERLQQDWINSERFASVDQRMEGLRQGFEVVIESAEIGGEFSHDR